MGGNKGGGKWAGTGFRRDPNNNKSQLTIEEKRAKARLHLEAFRAAKALNPQIAHGAQRTTYGQQLLTQRQESDIRRNFVREALLNNCGVAKVSSNSIMFTGGGRVGGADVAEADVTTSENLVGEAEQKAGCNLSSASCAGAAVGSTSGASSKPIPGVPACSDAEFLLALNWHENLEFLATAELEFAQHAQQDHATSNSGVQTAKTIEFPQLDEYYTSLLAYVARTRFGLQVLPALKADLSRGKVVAGGGTGGSGGGGLRVRIPSNHELPSMSVVDLVAMYTQAAEIPAALDKSKVFSEVRLRTLLQLGRNYRGIRIQHVEGRAEQADVGAGRGAGDDLLFLTNEEGKKRAAQEQNKQTGSGADDGDSDEDDDDSFIGGGASYLKRMDKLKRRRLGDVVGGTNVMARGDGPGRESDAPASISAVPHLHANAPHYFFLRFQEHEGKSWKDDWVRAKWPSVKLQPPAPNLFANNNFSTSSVGSSSGRSAGSKTSKADVDVNPYGNVLSFAFTPSEFNDKEGIEIQFVSSQTGEPVVCPGSASKSPILLRLVRAPAGATSSSSSAGSARTLKTSTWKLKMKGLLENVEHQQQQGAPPEGGGQQAAAPLFWMDLAFEFDEAKQRIWIAFVGNKRIVIGTYPGLLESKIAEFRLKEELYPEVDSGRNNNTGVGVSFKLMQPTTPAAGASAFGFGRAAPTVTSISLQPRKLSPLLWCNEKADTAVVPTKETVCFISEEGLKA